jgi:hypothetical protein
MLLLKCLTWTLKVKQLLLLSQEAALPTHCLLTIVSEHKNIFNLLPIVLPSYYVASHTFSSPTTRTGNANQGKLVGGRSNRNFLPSFQFSHL